MNPPVNHDASMPEIGAMSLSEFCMRYGLSRAMVFRMRREGRGPDVIQAGTRVLITFDAARRWERLMIERNRSDQSETA